MSQRTALISRFQDEIKSLGGQCHLASTLVEVADMILELAINADCKSVVIESYIDDNDEIRSTLIKHGIEATRLQGPYSTLELLGKADMGITHGDMAVAQTGTVIIKTTRDEDRLLSCLPRVHIALLSTAKLVEKVSDATQYLKINLQTHDPCAISFVSGPSRTSDIEMKQVLGVHGPHEVHVILYEE